MGKRIPPVDKCELEDSVPHCVLRLPKRQRKIVIAYYYQGKIPEDIASFFGISIGAVHVALRRAERRLKSLLS